MVSTKTIFVALSALTLAQATTLHANSGCIEANGRGTCKGGALNFQGDLTVLACVDGRGDSTYANCKWSGSVPTGWEQAYWGADNCIYSAGKHPIQLGCASNIPSQKITPVYGW